jgi:hypothetical protein
MARDRQCNGGTRESKRSENIAQSLPETTKGTRTYLRFDSVNASGNRHRKGTFGKNGTATLTGPTIQSHDIVQDRYAARAS